MQALIGLKMRIIAYLYTNEDTDCLKPAGISVAFIHQHHVNDRLHNSENRSRSPFDRSNFICLSSTLMISGFQMISNEWRIDAELS